MTKPVTIPNTFATATTAIPLSNLDADFSTIATALNDANTYSNYAADTGTANAYVVTLTGVSTTYTAGLRIQFKAGNANTGASTLNVNAGGTKNITFQDASALSSGTIAANAIVDVMYDGTQFLLMNDPAGTVGTGDVVGPASATDNAIARFDGTSGKIIQNSAVTVADTTGDITGGKYNGLTITTSTGTLTIANGKTLTANNTLTLSGTDSTTMTFPSTSATIARTDAAQTFTGTQTFSSDASVNGVTVGRGAGAQVETTVVGNGALASNSTGNQNTAIGFSALTTSTAGTANAAVGAYALRYFNGNYNIAVGVQSMQGVNGSSTGSNNTAIGHQSLFSNTTASNNTAVGYQAGYSNTTGTRNLFQGYQAAYYNTTGNDNTALGYGAYGWNTGAVNATGSSNTAVGSQALAANTTASNNTAVGYGAGYNNTTGARNAFFGYTAGYSNTTASANSAFGDSALYSNTTGAGNNAFGYFTLYANTTGVANTAIGGEQYGVVDAAMRSNTTGSYNTAVGVSALKSNTTSQQNTAVGYQALSNVLPATISVSAGALTNGVEYTITGLGTVNWTSIGAASATVGVKFTYNNVAITGSGGSVTQNVNANNVAIGYQAGDVITTGTGNVIIGGGADPSVNSGTDQIVIGNGVTGQANTNVTIGNGTGKIYNAYTVNATWTQTSDGTMKNVIGPDSLGLSFINRLNPILFTWKAQNDLPPDHPYYAEENKRDTTRVIHGFVAQEVKAALDAEGCSTFNGWDQGDDGIQAISREMFISPLVKAVQELSAQVEQLKAELAALKGA